MAALLQNPSKYRESVFASVFPVSSVVHTTPTPGATPEVGVGFSTPSQPYHYNSDNSNNNNIANIDASTFGRTIAAAAAAAGGADVGVRNVSNTSTSSNATFVDALPEQQQNQQQSPHAPADIDQIAARIIKRDAAWSTATRHLSFPRREKQPRGHDDDVTEALAYLLDTGAGAGDGDGIGRGFDIRQQGRGMDHDIVGLAN